MKFALASDIHLEFGPIELKNTEGADVLVLSGDICVAKDLRSPDPYEIMDTKKSAEVQKFFAQCCEEFKYVIYVMGNHEHYHGDFKYTINMLRKNLSHHKNLHILDKESLMVDDVIFVGGTLWTDMNKEDPHTLYAIAGVMNDFKTVNNSNHVRYFRDEDGNSHERVARLMPEDVVVDHKEMVSFIDSVCAMNPYGKIVVVGHHAPSKQSTHPRYKGEQLINGAYSSDLSEFMLDRPQIKVWTHGHTHEPFDYMIGNTRVVANPRGYINYEELADHFKLQYIEV
jgi:Icc-related predicted phosphoesterase